MSDSNGPKGGPSPSDLALTPIENGTQAVGGSPSNPIDLTVEEEHPDALKIRRQVEYYFSDENLPQDLHLLQCCGGRQNLPVSISRIRGFKKMRQFKNKKLVVEALRKSAFLQVSDDGKHITRKVPLAGPCLLDEADDDGEIVFDPRTQKPVAHPIPLLPQKKKEYPPGVTKNMLKPTGFEETFVEGPITPAEAEEDMAMYDPDKPFVERIEIAIQRFKSKKRMHEKYAKIFNKWMRFGGVEMSPRMFSALSKQDMAEMDAEQIAKALAVHHVPWDREDPKHWVVDFLGVGEAFLSSYYPLNFGYEPRQITTACQVLRSFYNYLLLHSVCDEYKDSLIFSRAFCDKAELELIKSSRSGLALPGAFNIAGSTIYGGSHADTSLIGQHWAKDATWNDGFDMGMRLEEAKVTFKTAIAMLGTDEQYDIVEGKNGKDGLASITVLNTEHVDLEVTSVEYATEEIKALYTKHNETLKHKLLLQPLGKLICKSWNKEDFDEYDLPKAKYSKGKLPKADIGKVYEFWIEDEVLLDCFEGAKIEAKVMTLSCGITIMDMVNIVHPSFYKWLPNELWMERHPREFRLLKKSLEGLDEEDLVEINGQIGRGEEVGVGIQAESSRFSD